MSHPFLPRLVWPFVGSLALLLALGRADFAVSATVDPYGDCCVAAVTTTGFNTWTVTCGNCATNPGRYAITQPDPARLVYTGPDGVSAASPYDAAAAICRCPSQDTRRAREKKMRVFDGN